MNKLSYIHKSLKLFRISNTDIVIHWSFTYLCVGLFIGLGIRNFSEVNFFKSYILDLAATFTLIFIIITSITFHEFAHILVANKIAGIQTPKVLITMIGGVACMEANLKIFNPKKELALTLAGPTSSAALALFFSILTIFNFPISIHYIVSFLASINLVIAIFNLIPMFPTDGGRILRSLLALKIDYRKSTQITRFVAIIFAMALISTGIMIKAYNLCLIGGIFGGICFIQFILEIKAYKSYLKIKKQCLIFLKKFPKEESTHCFYLARDSFITNFSMVCHIAAIINNKEKAYGFINCTSCTKKNLLCPRYLENLKLIEKKHKKVIQKEFLEKVPYN